MTLFADAGPRRVTLVRLSAEIARSLASVGRVSVEGEVTRPSRGATGRVWFTLRDRVSQITVTCPASRAAAARVVQGERVCVTGSITWANDRGQAQLVAEEVSPVGAGAIAAAIAEARARLAADGLIDRPRRPLPLLPALIGVVCGSEAAVRADIESVVASRFPGYPVDFLEVAVSGPGSAEGMADAIRRLATRPGVEVVILARGGGDAAQLLPFSDEALCRAICQCPVPVVTAIGHEGDRPLCDEVADLRCGTPSLAASRVVPDREHLELELRRLHEAVGAAAEAHLAVAARRLASADRDRSLTMAVERCTARLHRAGGRLELLHPKGAAGHARHRLTAAARQLDALSPARVLERGYAVIRGESGVVLRSAAAVRPGERVAITLAQGELLATVDEVRP